MKRREFLGRIGQIGIFGAICGFPDSLSAAADGDYDKIRGKLAGMKLLVVPFSHVDWAWVNSRQWMIHRHSIVLAEALDLLKTTPDFRFYIENWNEQFDAFLQRLPERVPEMRSALQQNKIAACGAFCNQHPSWMEQESYIRNIVIGRKLFQEFAPGLNLEVMTHNDVTPGPSQMPQILSKGGYRYFHANRPDLALTEEGVPRDFFWVGPDGSKLLTSRGFVCGFMGTESLPGDFATNWKKSVEQFYQKEIGYRLKPSGENVLLLPFGCDDSRPLRSWLNISAEPQLPVAEFIREWKKREKIPLNFGTPIDFFHALDEIGTLPSHTGVLDPCMWTYWYGLNGNQGLRYWRTQADEALVSSECLWSVASALGESYPESRHEHLWRELLRAYSHAQMWLYSADYAVQLDRVKTTLSLSKGLREEAMQRIAGRVKVKSDRPSIVLFNDLPWERTEVVPVWADLHDVTATNMIIRDSGGNQVPFQPVDVNWYRDAKPHTPLREANVLVLTRIPAMGYATLYFEPAPGGMSVAEKQKTVTTLDTEFATLEFSGSGVESLLDKQTGAHYKLPGRIIFNEIEDTGPYHYGPVIKTHYCTNVELSNVVRGRLRSSFTIRGALGSHQVKLTGHLYPHSRRMVFEADINSAGGSGHFMTTLGFTGPGKLAADTHFCVEDRDVSKIAYKGQERLRQNVFYGAHWVDHSDGEKGVTLVGSKGEKGYQFFPEENALGHFLLMVIPVEPTNWERFVTDAREGKNLQRFEYSLLFHSGGWKEANVVRRALEIQHPILTLSPNNRSVPQKRTLPEENSFLTLSPATVQCSAFYHNKDRSLLRVWESAGSPANVSLEFPFPIAAANQIDFNGNPLQKPISLNGKTVRFNIKPWEIVTLSIK